MNNEAEDDIPRMKLVLQLKLEQHPELKQKLLDTGDALLGEDCSKHDRESARWWVRCARMAMDRRECLRQDLDG